MWEELTKGFLTDVGNANKLIFKIQKICRLVGGGGLGERGEGVKKYNLAVTKWSQGCKVRHREYSQ